jgi:hypothetical protein
MNATILCRALLAAAAAATAAAAGAEGAPARHLLVQVRDTPPHGPAAIRHGADGSYSVSTGSGADRDDRGDQAPDNATILSTSNRIRRVHVLEGERVRVDLPAVQSLQFHGVRAGGTTAGKAAAGGSAATASGAASAAPSTSGVVYFEAVTAFAARFALAGRMVRIELTPLHRGGVSAPFAAGAAGTEAPVTVSGRLGEWIALGDTDLADSGKSLTPTAEPTTPASVWVRVDPEAADVAQ